MRREFRFVEGTSSKFWAITLEGSAHTVEFGRIGTAGQAKTKAFASPAAAKADADKLVAEKTKKGYVAVGGGTSAPAAEGEEAPAGKGQGKGTGKGKTAKAKAAPAPTAEGDEAEEHDRAGGDQADARAKAAPAPTAQGATAEGAKAAPASSAKPAAAFEVERRLDLDPADLAFATWRPRPAATPAPALAPYDQAATLAALERVKSLGWKGHDWERAKVPEVMTAEEARCWLLAMCTSHGKPLQQTGSKIVAHAATEPADPVEWTFDALSAARGLDTPLLVPVLLHVVPADRALDVLLDDRLGQLNSRTSATVADGVRRYLLPRLDAKAFAEAAARARELYDPARWPPAGGYVNPPILFSVAPLFGLHAELLALVEGWADDAFATPQAHFSAQAAQRVVLGLGSAELVERHMRRLKLAPSSTALVRGWLATTGHAALDVVQAAIERAGNKEEAAALADALALAVSVENATVMLALRASKAAAVAGAWLDAHPGTAAAGLLATAAGRGAAADAALSHLRALVRAGHEAGLRRLLDDAPPEVAGKLRAALFEQAQAAPPLAGTPSWLAAAGLKPQTLPSLAQPAALPPLVTEGKGLTPDHLGVVLAALRETAKAGAVHPVVAAVRERCTPGSRDAFGWALFERWLAEGAPPREKWAFQALGQLGTDASALRLSPLVRGWPGESQHQRAVTGLEVLRTIGTDTALMQLSGISQKVKFKGLKQKAQDLMEEIARGRGLSRAELEDRIVPTCDLDERGTRAFDFGPRQFHFTLGPDLKPMVKDQDGKLVGDLPKPGKKDDAAKAGEAVLAWKLLKKQVKEVASIQAGRLEQAMVTGRRWKTADFEALLVRHPLLTHLVRLLVWGAHDAKGKRVATFRVAEDGTYADAQDEPTTLEKAAEVSLVHPLHLSPAERAAWGQVLADYQLIPPFEQLGRPVHEATAAEQKATDLDRLAGKKVPPTTLVGILDKTGWTRGVPQDGGVYFEHTKHFPGADATAVLQYDGIPIGGMMDWQDVAVERLFFVPGLYQVVSYPDHKERKKLGDVDPVAVSEALRLLEVLKEKAR